MEYMWLTLLFLGVCVLIILLLAGVTRKAKEEERKNTEKKILRLEKSNLSPISTSLMLREKEICYFSTSAQLVKEKTTKGAMIYHGPVVRVKLADGVHYRAAIVAGRGAVQTDWVPVDSGTVYLTDSRIIFRGGSKNTSCPLRSIIEFNWYTDDTVRVDKQSGAPFILSKLNSRIFAYYFDRVYSGHTEASPALFAETKDAVGNARADPIDVPISLPHTATEQSRSDPIVEEVDFRELDLFVNKLLSINGTAPANNKPNAGFNRITNPGQAVENARHIGYLRRFYEAFGTTPFPGIALTQVKFIGDDIGQGSKRSDDARVISRLISADYLSLEDGSLSVTKGGEERLEQ